jgi:hypothetical protein
MALCDYKHIFGEEGKGVHSIRMLNIAIVDVLLTLVAAVIIAKALKISLWFMVILLFTLGIIAHRLFCVNTTVNKWIFGVV